MVEPDTPGNLSWVYSYGGTQDHLLDPGVDRVADVFPDEDAIEAGSSSQEASDLPPAGPSLGRAAARRSPLASRRATQQITLSPGMLANRASWRPNRVGGAHHRPFRAHAPTRPGQRGFPSGQAVGGVCWVIGLR
uniref:GP88 family protein n=1 Tax=Asanoa ishikariensis TaxID=137265 RepID=UPI003570B70B